MQLSSWRKAHKLGQLDVAEKLGVIVVTVSRWERFERTPTAKLQIEIFKLTNGEVTPNDWMGLTAECGC
jgi:transcriptional regulator with XRE-family HTH domain